MPIRSKTFRHSFIHSLFSSWLFHKQFSTPKYQVIKKRQTAALALSSNVWILGQVCLCPSVVASVCQKSTKSTLMSRTFFQPCPPGEIQRLYTNFKLHFCGHFLVDDTKKCIALASSFALLAGTLVSNRVLTTFSIGGRKLAAISGTV